MAILEWKKPCVYILASRPNGVLYIGVTSNIAQRIYQHKHGQLDGFTRRYNVHLLVYVEFHDRMGTAILREKQMKKWNRQWKVELIETINPSWKDLSQERTES